MKWGAVLWGWTLHPWDLMPAHGIRVEWPKSGWYGKILMHFGHRHVLCGAWIQRRKRFVFLHLLSEVARWEECRRKAFFPLLYRMSFAYSGMVWLFHPEASTTSTSCPPFTLSGQIYCHFVNVCKNKSDLQWLDLAAFLILQSKMCKSDTYSRG